MRFVDRGTVTPKAMQKKSNGDPSPADREVARFRVYFAQKNDAALAAQHAAAIGQAPVIKNAEADDEAKESKPTFSVYKHSSVEERLHELFHGKCAYCESFYFSTAPVDTEHFRPKGRLQEDAEHGGYWWLAATWDNLLPSCIHCNRRSGQITPTLSAQLVQLIKAGTQFSASSQVQSGKHDSFPILGKRATESEPNYLAEYPLLLDPCRDNPSEHLRFHIDRDNLIGLVLPRSHDGAGLPVGDVEGAADELAAEISRARATRLSVKGAVSIQTYGLNRLGLVQDRTRVLRHLVFLERMVMELSSLMMELEDEEGIAPTSKQKVMGRLSSLRDLLLQQMKEMGEPDAPYTVMVQEWTADFLKRLKSTPQP